MKPGGKKTQIENCDKLWAIPSSSSPVDSDLKALAIERLGQRFQITSNHFDEYVRIRTSCWILEQKGKNFYCDCPIGSKGHMCKHFPGISYKLGLLEVTADVRSKPLGQKRKRGRPQMAKAGHCLVRSPEKRIDFSDFFDHPFLDLEHFPDQDSVQRASKIASEAVAADKSKNKEQAAELYEEALKHFRLILYYQV